VSDASLEALPAEDPTRDVFERSVVGECSPREVFERSREASGTRGLEVQRKRGPPPRGLRAKSRSKRASRSGSSTHAHAALCARPTPARSSSPSAPWFPSGDEGLRDHEVERRPERSRGKVSGAGRLEAQHSRCALRMTLCSDAIPARSLSGVEGPRALRARQLNSSEARPREVFERSREASGTGRLEAQPAHAALRA
jgi:hypothetical protein